MQNKTWGQVLVVLQFSCFGLLALSILSTPTIVDQGAQIGGTFISIVGVLIILLAIWQFQRQNRRLPKVTPEPNQDVALVTGGLYKYIRHPIYTGVILVVIGSALGHGQAADWLITGALIIILSIKARFEEAMLRTIYSDYRRYMKKTGRFLPRLF